MVAPMVPPVGNVYVPCTWQCHKDRKPPSTEPGTDYAVSYGTAVYAPFTGKVHDIKNTNTGAAGRVVYLIADDGSTWVRLLHLSAISVSIGQRVTMGQTVVGKSGASGYGSDHYYGPHVHVSLWVGWATTPTPGITPTVDFQAYLSGDPADNGNVTPFPPPTTDPEEDDDMANMKGAAYTTGGKTIYLLFNEGSGFWVEHSGVDSAYNNSIASKWQTGSWPTITAAHAAVIKSALDKTRTNTA
jgi:murein DD-endopeptidase